MTDFGPVFILGNSPRLPIDDLDCLEGQFTVGVNRILQSGFTPTVLLWVDGSVYRTDEVNRALMDDSDAIMVCDKSVWDVHGHHGLLTHVGEAAQAKPAKPTELICNGNTGVCAARWAHSLGCSPVYLVGMDATYTPDGKTDFYGVNPHHHKRAGDNGTAAQLRAEVEWLKVQLGDVVVEVSDGQFLREIARMYDARDLDQTKRKIVRMLNGCSF